MQHNCNLSFTHFPLKRLIESKRSSNYLMATCAKITFSVYEQWILNTVQCNYRVQQSQEETNSRACVVEPAGWASCAGLEPPSIKKRKKIPAAVRSGRCQVRAPHLCSSSAVLCVLCPLGVRSVSAPPLSAYQSEPSRTDLRGVVCPQLHIHWLVRKEKNHGGFFFSIHFIR